jgi:hypothetical protein
VASSALLCTSDFGPCIPFLISVDNGPAGLTGEAGMASLSTGENRASRLSDISYAMAVRDLRTNQALPPGDLGPVLELVSLGTRPYGGQAWTPQRCRTLGQI